MSLYKFLLFASLFNTSITYACEVIGYFDEGCGEVVTVETEEFLDSNEEDQHEVLLKAGISNSKLQTEIVAFQNNRDSRRLLDIVNSLVKLGDREFSQEANKIANKFFSNNTELFKKFCEYKKENLYIFRKVENFVLSKLVANDDRQCELKIESHNTVKISQDNDIYLDILYDLMCPQIDKTRKEKNYELIRPNNSKRLQDFIQDQIYNYCYYLYLKYNGKNISQEKFNKLVEAFKQYQALAEQRSSGNSSISVEIMQNYLKEAFQFCGSVERKNANAVLRHLEIEARNKHQDIVQKVLDFLYDKAELISDNIYEKLAAEYIKQEGSFGDCYNAAIILLETKQQNRLVENSLRQAMMKRRGDHRLVKLETVGEYKLEYNNYSCTIDGSWIKFGTAVIKLDNGEEIYVCVGDTYFTTDNVFEYISKRKRQNGKNVDLRDLHINESWKLGEQVLVGEAYISSIDEGMKKFLKERNIEFVGCTPFVVPLHTSTHIVKNGYVFINGIYYDIDSFCNSRLNLFKDTDEEVYNKLKDILLITYSDLRKYDVYIKPTKKAKIHGSEFSEKDSRLCVTVPVDDVKKYLKTIVPECSTHDEISKNPYYDIVLEVWGKYWKALPKSVRIEEVKKNPRYKTLYKDLTGNDLMSEDGLIDGEEFDYGWLA